MKFIVLLVWTLVSVINGAKQYHGFYFDETQCLEAGKQLIGVDSWFCKSQRKKQ